MSDDEYLWQWEMLEAKAPKEAFDDEPEDDE